MADEEDYPPLAPLQNLEPRAMTLERRLEQVELQCNMYAGLLNTHTKLFFGFLEREVVILGGEILKWSVNKRGETDGDGCHLFDSNPDVQRMVLLGCRAYGEFGARPNRSDVSTYKTMSQEVIKARNSTVHFQDLAALDVMARSCSVAIQEWPMLEVKYPAQVRIIRNYKTFKQLLPECFQ